MTERHDLAEVRRAEYRAVVQYELAITQMRFQTLAIFLAAVGFIVGLGHSSRSVGGLLLVITMGLWIIDLRNRDMLTKYRWLGSALEGQMGDEARLFRSREAPASTAVFGFLSAQWAVRGRIARLIAFQVGVDLIFLGVIAYALTLVLNLSGWAGASLLGGALLGALVVAVALTRSDRNVSEL